MSTLIQNKTNKLKAENIVPGIRKTGALCGWLGLHMYKARRPARVIIGHEINTSGDGIEFSLKP